VVSDPQRVLGAEACTSRGLGAPREGPDGHRSIDLDRKLFDPDLHAVFQRASVSPFLALVDLCPSFVVEGR
jgi:hypothetical protein